MSEPNADCAAKTERARRAEQRVLSTINAYGPMRKADLEALVGPDAECTLDLLYEGRLGWDWDYYLYDPHPQSGREGDQ